MKLMVEERTMRFEQQQEQRQENAILMALRHLLARLWFIATKTDFDFAEIVSGGAGVAWGLWLFNPFLDTFASTPAFEVMALLPEWLVGAMVAMGGAWQVWAALAGHLPSRVWANRGGVATWSVIAVLLFMGNPAGTGLVTYLVLASVSCWAGVRLAKVEHDLRTGCPTRRHADWVVSDDHR